MSNLIVVAYEDRATAENALETLSRLQSKHVIALADAVVATRDDQGKIMLHQSGGGVAPGGFGGSMWGGLIGLILFVPLLGMAVGGAAGALAGKGADVGIDDEVIKTIGGRLERGQALLFLLVVHGPIDTVIPELRQFGGDIVQTSLSNEAEEALRAAMDRLPAAA